MEEDPAQHFPIIHHVITQMGLNEWERDEAFSEGLVAITEALRSFDPDKGQLAGWLARNIRWSIKSWQIKQNYNWSKPYPPVVMSTDHLSLESKVMFNDLLRLIGSELTKREQVILMATAVGYNGKEIAEYLKVSEMTVVRSRRSAQAKLRALLKEDA